ncbi:lipocalin family protein [Nocardia sp. NPDC005978]|uniref:lipocalin family protein n=1 Tax=unclassified Nocardia TaxID=2637762 RepID=UPI0033A7E302
MNTTRSLSASKAAYAVTAGVCAALLATSAPASAAPAAPVPNLELARYLGTWNQLAAIPQFFNLVCARDTRANYSLDPAGDVTVRNSCTTWTGDPNEIVGTAKVTDPATNAQLAVNFRGETKTETNYVVTALDPGYGWALVVNPTRTAGFVLSRTPVLTDGQWSEIRTAITAAGANDCLFLTSPTTGGYDAIEPLCTKSITDTVA